jgi:protein-S-isoprenylcysteine O-methyltransferase Ste14
MPDQPNAENPAAEPGANEVKVGGLIMSRRRLFITRLIVLPIIAGLIVLTFYLRPRIGMLVSAGIWLVFNIYWTSESRKSKATKKSETQKSTLIHQIAMNMSLVLLFAPIPGLVHHFLPESNLVIAIGLGVQLIFIGLGVWARRHLGRNWSSTVRVAQEHELVRSGPYRFVRHPIYTAMLGMSIGTTIVAGQYHAVLGVLIMFVAYMRKTRLEEIVMRQEFGAVYENYLRHSWALIPGIF